MPIFNNQATLTYSGGTVNSNITTGEIIEVLSANKTALTNSYTQGSEVTYAINLINSGNTPVSGLTLTDDLGAFAFGEQTLRPLEYIEESLTVFADGVLQTDPEITETPSLVITPLSVPANGVTTVLYTVRVNTLASPEPTGIITNTAVISGLSVAEITVTESITAAAEPRLTIIKSVSPTVVNENGQITYTFVIQNTSGTAAVATDSIIVTDTFDPVLNDIRVTYNGSVWTESENYTYNEDTGEFATVLGEITVPAAAFTQDPATSEWIIDPGEAVIAVTGTL